MKMLFAVLFTAAALLLPAAEELKIRGSAFGNWYLLGDEVCFKPEKKATRPLQVILRDGNEKTILTETISAEAFNQEGWRWKAVSPGFYDVQFQQDGEPVTDWLHRKLHKQDPQDKRRYKLVEDMKLPIARHNFVVATEATRPVSEISPQFGMSPHGDRYKTILPLSRLVGFGAIRYHAVHWDWMEKKKGEINWEPLDDFFRKAHELGYTDDRIVLNVFGVPQWASSRPEADWINICVYEYAAVVPRDLDDWRNFLRALMRRYPGVRNWELWNEPHLVGFSCFWSDTTENFIRLLKAGYETVKEENPENIVILGGIGTRYLPFYKEFLEKGGGESYDVFGVHAAARAPFIRSTFAGLDRARGVPVRPWRVTEWHANLLNPHMTPYPSERQLARPQLLNFLHLIRQGAQAVDLFCITNNQEKEELPIYDKHKLIGHTAGLFRSRPYLQPRYVAATWHVFTDLIKGTLEVGSGYAFPKDQAAVVFRSDAGPMLLVWNRGDEPTGIDPALFAALDGKRVLTGDGRSVAVPADFRLLPDEYYLVTDPDMAVVGTWRNTAEVLLPKESSLPLDESVRGEYRPGRLFNDRMEVIDPDTLSWQRTHREIPYAERRTDPSNRLEARFAVGCSPEGIDLIAEVTDSTHFPNPGSEAWKGDSLQFALDTAERGLANDILEFSVWRAPDGETVVYKQIAPMPMGDLPDGYTFANSIVRNAKALSERREGKTVYKVHIANSELYPYACATGCSPRFSFLVNNNDGKGRDCYLEWGSGIGGDKDPTVYGRLTTQLEDKVFLTEADFNRKCWDTPFSWEYRDGVLSLQADGAVNSGLRTGKPLKLVPGASYRITFEARGTGRLQLMLYGEGVPRTDPVLPTPLTGEYRNFDVRFTAPPNGINATIQLFFWQQPDAKFEVRNLKVTK